MKERHHHVSQDLCSRKQKQKALQYFHPMFTSCYFTCWGCRQLQGDTVMDVVRYSLTGWEQAGGILTSVQHRKLQWFWAQ